MNLAGRMMADDRESGGGRQDGTYDQASVREWARKCWLRQNMRANALPPHELATLDDRLARWTADHQLAGKLPPDWDLAARRPALEREFRHGRDAARPFFTPEEQRAVDASRGAVALRDMIDRNEDHGPALSRLSTQHMVANGIGVLDARKGISERFHTLHGRSVPDYVQERNRPDAPVRERDTTARLLPKELGWDKYEPACRRLAAFNALLFVGERDGTLSNREIHDRRKLRDRWIHDQRERGALPSTSGAPGNAPPLNELLLPYQKQLARRERQKSLGEEGAYWRRVDELAGHVRQEIDETRRYTRALDDCAISAAGAYRRPVDHVKRDIVERFTQRYLDSPAEYLEARLEKAQARSPGGEPEISASEVMREEGKAPRRTRGRTDRNGRER